MEKKLVARINTEINNILHHIPTTTELAEWYLKERPSRSIKASFRNDVRTIISGFNLIEEKQDLINELTNACIYFTPYICFEAGYATNELIEERLLTSKKVNSKIDESIKALEIVSGMPLSVGTKAELMAYAQFLCNSSNVMYLEHSQLTALQELCARLPEAIEAVTYAMGQRPFAKAPIGKTLMYQQALTKVVYTLLKTSIPTTQSKKGKSATDLLALTAGLLDAFFNSFPSFSIDVEKVKNSRRKDKIK